MNLQHDRIAALCEQLKLDRLSAEWPGVAQTTIDNSGTHADFLEAVLQLQHDGQNERRRQTILRLSGLPVIKNTGAVRLRLCQRRSTKPDTGVGRSGIYRTSGERCAARTFWRRQDAPGDRHWL